MIGDREHNFDLRDTEVRIEISLGDDTLVRVVGIDKLPFGEIACHLYRSRTFFMSLG